MYLDSKKIAQFVKTYFGGNFNECARRINVAPSTAWRVAHGYNKAGLKLMTCVIDYCKKIKVNYHDMIFID